MGPETRRLCVSIRERRGRSHGLTSADQTHEPLAHSLCNGRVCVHALQDGVGRPRVAAHLHRGGGGGRGVWVWVWVSDTASELRRKEMCAYYMHRDGQRGKAAETSAIGGMHSCEHIQGCTSSRTQEPSRTRTRTRRHTHTHTQRETHTPSCS